MIKYVIAWGIITPAVFVFFVLASELIKFCLAHEKQWWGGLPLWMTGAIGGLIPLAILIVYTVYRILHD